VLTIRVLHAIHRFSDQQVVEKRLHEHVQVARGPKILQADWGKEPLSQSQEIININIIDIGWEWG
jgi:hypothetical protein